MPTANLILDADSISRILSRIAHEIAERNTESTAVALVGVQRGGVLLAERLSRLLEEMWGTSIPIGQLDVSMHRDDLDQRSVPDVYPTVIPFDLNDKNVVLVDDVLFSGRTTRAAMDALNDFGRPKSIQLAVLVDRGFRQLPIKADFVGKYLPTTLAERINVQLSEQSIEDAVYVEKA